MAELNIHNKVSNALTEVKENLKLSIPNETFWKEFIDTLEVKSINTNTIALLTKNLFAKHILTNEYSDKILALLNKNLNSQFNVRFVTEDEKEESTRNPNSATQIINKPLSINSLNPNYTFANFIVSDFNKNAYNAAQSLFKNTFWNPIFISANVGLGKTHLLHAMGNEYVKRNPNKIVKYVSSDEFIREIYGALTSNTIEILKDKYQSVDLLLVDDIQFLAKKEKINEIFFHIFNNNVGRGQIIVMTSDKAPSLLENFEDRMKSRFASGLMIKIGKPDLQSVQKILEEKIKEAGENFVFTKDALNYIVHRNSNDIRHLEGYLHRVLFYAINNLPPRAIINMNTIKTTVDNESADNISEYGFDVNPDVIISQICVAYSINPDLVKSKVRTKQSTLVRHVCMYVLRTKYNMPLEQIGSYFSGRSHSTVMEGIEKIESKLKSDQGMREFIHNLSKKI